MITNLIDDFFNTSLIPTEIDNILTEYIDNVKNININQKRPSVTKNSDIIVTIINRICLATNELATAAVKPLILIAFYLINNQLAPSDLLTIDSRLQEKYSHPERLDVVSLLFLQKDCPPELYERYTNNKFYTHLLLDSGYQFKKEALDHIIANDILLRPLIMRHKLLSQKNITHAQIKNLILRIDPDDYLVDVISTSMPVWVKTAIYQNIFKLYNINNFDNEILTDKMINNLKYLSYKQLKEIYNTIPQQSHNKNIDRISNGCIACLCETKKFKQWLEINQLNYTKLSNNEKIKKQLWTHYNSNIIKNARLHNKISATVDLRK